MDSLWLGLLPSPNVSSAWRSFSDVQVWANIEDGLARSVFRVLGDPGLNSLPLIAAIPISAFENALTQAQRGTRSLYETEKAQMRVAFNAIRVCFGGSPLGMTQTAGPTPNCPSRGEIPKILKLAWGKAFVEVVAMRRLACV